jgi:hypothetical protein
MHPNLNGTLQSGNYIRVLVRLRLTFKKMTTASTGHNGLIQIVPKYSKTIKAAPRHVNTKDDANLRKQHDTSQGLITYGQSA